MLVRAGPFKARAASDRLAHNCRLFIEWPESPVRGPGIGYCRDVERRRYVPWACIVRNEEQAGFNRAISPRRSVFPARFTAASRIDAWTVFTVFISPGPPKMITFAPCLASLSATNPNLSGCHFLAAPYCAPGFMPTTVSLFFIPNELRSSQAELTSSFDR